MAEKEKIQSTMIRGSVEAKEALNQEVLKRNEGREEEGRPHQGVRNVLDEVLIKVGILKKK